jgi:hypothetical protein
MAGYSWRSIHWQARARRFVGFGLFVAGRVSQHRITVSGKINRKLLTVNELAKSDAFRLCYGFKHMSVATYASTCCMSHVW